MRSFIANTIVKWFKRIPYAGRFRFWCLYWAYRLTGWHIRNKEWDFVLEYLPPLAKWQMVSVLDVGCSRNLLCHEIVGRGYKLTGIDLEEPSFKYPGNLFKTDIRTTLIGHNFDFIISVSVLEHIKADEKGNSLDAIEKIIKLLKINGRALITIPTEEFAQGHDWDGFTYKQIEGGLPNNAEIIEYTERAGQICIVIAKISK